MTVEDNNDLMGLMAIGRIIGETIKRMAEHVKPGVTTRELDEIGAAYLKKNGANSAPILTYKFPGWTCISINEEAAHGIPGDRVIKPGDLVNIDVSAAKNGYYADSATTVAVGEISAEAQDLLDTTRHALELAIETARAGQPINAIGKAVEDYATGKGYSIIRELPGHGVGRRLHEEPSVPNYYVRRLKKKLTEGLVVTLEPFISAGSRHIVTDDDGWTLRTKDNSLNAQFEHTVIITKERPVLVTAV
jgi:methionyl aminopeptidase